jgi:hypothetical protein
MSAHSDQCDVCGRFAFESCNSKRKCPRNMLQSVEITSKDHQSLMSALIASARIDAEPPQAITEPPPVAVVAATESVARPSADSFQKARQMGYTGDMCQDCSNFTMVRNGTCLKCTTCGGTSGCS